MKIEWDEEKNALNLRKHGLDFADAEPLFRGFVMIHLDLRIEHEDRWTGFGLLDGNVVNVIFTESEEGTIRLISLRPATRQESLIYEQELKDRLESHSPDEG